MAPREFPWPAPFVAASVLAYALLALSESVDTVWLAVAVVVNVALLVLIWSVPWQQLPVAAIATPALLFLFVVVCLREASGTTSGYTPLVLLPIVWLGLHSRLGEIAVASIGVGAVVLVPAVVDHGIDGNSVRASLLFAMVAFFAGLAIRRQVKATAHEAAKVRQLQAVHLNDAVVQQLTRAQLALEIDDIEHAREAIGTALTGAKQIVTNIVRSTEANMAPGKFRVAND